MLSAGLGSSAYVKGRLEQYYMFNAQDTKVLVAFEPWIAPYSYLTSHQLTDRKPTGRFSRSGYGPVAKDQSWQ